MEPLGNLTSGWTVSDREQNAFIVFFTIVNQRPRCSVYSGASDSVQTIVNIFTTDFFSVVVAVEGLNSFSLDLHLQARLMLTGNTIVYLLEQFIFMLSGGVYKFQAIGFVRVEVLHDELWIGTYVPKNEIGVKKDPKKTVCLSAHAVPHDDIGCFRNFEEARC